MSSESGVGESEEALPSVSLPAPLIGHFKEEDDDVHKCGRCQAEFTSLEEFVQHKIQKSCRKVSEQNPSATLPSRAEQVVPAAEDALNVPHAAVEVSSIQEEIGAAQDEGSEEVKEAFSSEDDEECDGQDMGVEWQASVEEGSQESPSFKIALDAKGRYLCPLCEKTFKTVNILKAHMLIHSNRKDFVCKLCGDAFRTKGSLIRHTRRHTGERPYVCTKCGKSFRESGALSRHMRSLTPCTEKMVLSTEPAYLNSQDENSSDTSSQPGTDDTSNAQVIRILTDDDGNLLHEVQVQAVTLKPRTEIVLGNPEELTCPQCSKICKSSNSLKVHLKGHEGFKLYRCGECSLEFLKAHLLRKHQESHANNRRYRCGECGKTYKTVAHVKGHMRVHSEDRPFPCTKCGKRYKTKNAQQVHLRTHFSDKPFVCPYCPNKFREKGSLVRHIRHHTGEKPFKCQRCGRGFAEHGTLNRHLKTKGGCVAHLQSLAEHGDFSEVMAEDVIEGEPHTVLVEFSSVVADTQEYIIEASEDLETSEAVELLQSTGTHEVDSRILKVVQQLVRTASPGQQIIVQNVTLDDRMESCIEEVPATDTITIATPESLTEQVALTLASAMEDGTMITSETVAAEEVVVPEVGAPEEVVAPEDVELVDQVGEFVITTVNEDEMEVQAVVV
ncbi:transcription factor E4F1 [Gastrophryne carolinensis]